MRDGRCCEWAHAASLAGDAQPDDRRSLERRPAGCPSVADVHVITVGIIRCRRISICCCLQLLLLLHDAHCHLMSIIDRQVGGDDDVDVRLRSSVDQVCIAADPDLTVEA